MPTDGTTSLADWLLAELGPIADRDALVTAIREWCDAMEASD